MSRWQALRGRYMVSADPLRTQRRIELVALLLGLFICLQLVWGLVGLAVTTGPGAIEPAADSLRVPAVAAPGVVAAAERNEIISRPLFWVGRRPLEAVAVVQEPDAGEIGSKQLQAVKLVGLFGGADTAGAIVLVKGKKQRILRGEALDGWTLEAIEPNAAAFTRSGQRESLTLEREVVSAAPADKAGRASQARTPPVQVKVDKSAARPVRSEASTAGQQAGDKAESRGRAAEKKGGSSLGLGPGSR